VHAGFGGRLPGKGPPTRDLAGQPTLHYEISVNDKGGWRASPIHDRSSVITADSPTKLREKIRLDYVDRHPVQQRMST
jgi:hypothetical protein